jgi:hypothetical protein
VAHGICILARKLGIGEALASNLEHEQREVIVFLPLIPWSYVWRQYAASQGERWR